MFPAGAGGASASAGAGATSGGGGGGAGPSSGGSGSLLAPPSQSHPPRSSVPKRGGLRSKDSEGGDLERAASTPSIDPAPEVIDEGTSSAGDEPQSPSSPSSPGQKRRGGALAKPAWGLGVGSSGSIGSGASSGGALDAAAIAAGADAAARGTDRGAGEVDSSLPLLTRGGVSADVTAPDGSALPVALDDSAVEGTNMCSEPVSGAMKRESRRRSGIEKNWQSWFLSQGTMLDLAVGFVVMCNAVVIGLETDYGAERFVLLENTFVVIFLIEALIRINWMTLSGYLADRWCVFDGFLLSMGVLDLWILPLITGAEQKKVGLSHLQALRLLRLLRVLRLFRVLRFLRSFSLFNIFGILAKTLGTAMQVVLSLVMLVGMLDYVLAVFLTQVAGHQSSMWEDEEDELKIQAWFGNIGASMRTLAQVMTKDNWSDIMETLSKKFPIFPVFLGFVGYIVFASYTLTCLITAVLSSQLMQQTLESKDQRSQRIDELRVRFGMDLHNQIAQALGANGVVQASDLRQVMQTFDGLSARLQECDIKIRREGISHLIDQLSMNGLVSVDYFVEKMMSMSTAAKASEIVDVKHLSIYGQLQLMQLQVRVHSTERKIRREMDRLQKRVGELLVRL
eukprot:CAMPEP_0206545910 /NCGR_PEP_ID=MMETSP0325_2-20121206/12403_1 /ASSEMBLY_ACC=CAM_ASM_000347 /TAXON_ID=2866 /ORGANISM="Crypthecodinium cohnii, Strain Seligo" /LENGTH=622 /DNA_ID=CAMNT_0054044957 /DNA_START=647 /DNA_END=2515 /DNA_ORIENTATION=-